MKKCDMNVKNCTIEDYIKLSRDNAAITTENVAALVRNPRKWELGRVSALSRAAADCDTLSLDVGSALHAYIADRAAFATKYIVADGPVNPKTGSPYGRETKAYREWLETLDRGVISTHDLELVEAMAGEYDRYAAGCGSSIEGPRIVVGNIDGVEALTRVDALESVGDEVRSCILVKTASDIDSIIAKRSIYIEKIMVRLAFCELVAGVRAKMLLLEKDTPSRYALVTLCDMTNATYSKTVRDAVQALVTGRETGIWGGVLDSRTIEL